MQTSSVADRFRPLASPCGVHLLLPVCRTRKALPQHVCWQGTSRPSSHIIAHLQLSQQPLHHAGHVRRAPREREPGDALRHIVLRGLAGVRRIAGRQQGCQQAVEGGVLRL